MHQEHKFLVINKLKHTGNRGRSTAIRDVHIFFCQKEQNETFFINAIQGIFHFSIYYNKFHPLIAVQRPLHSKVIKTLHLQNKLGKGGEKISRVGKH